MPKSNPVTVWEARARERRKKPNYERIRIVIAEIKQMIRRAEIEEVKTALAEAGEKINMLLLK